MILISILIYTLDSYLYKLENSSIVLTFSHVLPLVPHFNCLLIPVSSYRTRIKGEVGVTYKENQLGIPWQLMQRRPLVSLVTEGFILHTQQEECSLLGVETPLHWQRALIFSAPSQVPQSSSELSQNLDFIHDFSFSSLHPISIYFIYNYWIFIELCSISPFLFGFPTMKKIRWNHYENNL